MTLHIHSDASYLSISHARSRLGGLFFCGDKPPNEENLNGSILNVAAIIKNVVASAAECAFKKPRLVHQSELISLNCDISHLRHHYGQIIQQPLEF
jgi:hypothetical protein